MTSPLHSRFRMIVALICGLLCLAGAAVHRFDTPQFNTPLWRFAIAAFGLAWLTQAYVIRNQIRALRG